MLSQCLRKYRWETFEEMKALWENKDFDKFFWDVYLYLEVMDRNSYINIVKKFSGDEQKLIWFIKTASFFIDIAPHSVEYKFNDDFTCFCRFVPTEKDQAYLDKFNKDKRERMRNGPSVIWDGSNPLPLRKTCTCFSP